MGTTTRGLPYQDGTDALVAGDNTGKTLATTLDARLTSLHTGWPVLAGTYAATDPIRTLVGNGSGTTDATGLIAVAAPFTKCLLTAFAHATGSATAGDVGVILIDRRYTGLTSVALCPLRKSGAFLPQGITVEFSFMLIGC